MNSKTKTSEVFENIRHPKFLKLRMSLTKKIMIKTTLKLAFRNLAKNKIHSIINITGLAIGFAVFILIGLYLKYEYSWDKINKNYDRIYRVQQRVQLSTGTEYWTQTQAALAKYIRENYPEAENTVLLREAWGEFLSSNDIQYLF